MPFIVPALNANGQKNISSDTGGALRWWVTPYWTSGASNGTPSTLVELDAVSVAGAACAWALQVSPDGNTVALFNQTGSGLQEVLQAPISWAAGTPHNVILDYGPQGTVLFLDGALAAQGTGLPSIPPSVGELVFGSDIHGTNTAGADFDEFYSFGSWLTATNAALYYGMTAPEAALGTNSLEAQAGLVGVNGGPGMQTIHTPGNVYDPDNDTNCSPGGPFYITNVSATLLNNGTTTVSFAIQGGTNGVFYDIFTTGNIGNSLADYQWMWIGQGLTCNFYTFTNQAPGHAFYALELPEETMVVAFGLNTSGQTNVPFGISNAVAVAGGSNFSLALRNNGTVIGWGDNTYGQTNVPAGLSNVVGIAAGMFHGVAVLANGSVTNWGSYYDDYLGTNIYCSVTNRAMASAPPTSGVVAVAAGEGQDLALMSNGTCIAWGFTNVDGTGPANGTQVPTNLNLTNVSAIACGWDFNVALSSNGTVTAWGQEFYGIYNLTNVPSDLTTNVAAIAAGGYNSVALRKNGTVEAWGNANSGVTNVPAGLSNVVAVATGGEAGLALQANGMVVAWGLSSLTNIPEGMAGVKAISAGFDHNLVIESGILDPVIFSQPTDQYALLGGSVTFTASGQGVAGVQYQWQFNGVNITGATNSTLTLNDVGLSNDGNYDVVVTTDTGSITSEKATFYLVVAPQITNTTPPAPSTNWINYEGTLSVVATPAAIPGYPLTYLTYGWQLNGTNIPGATSSSYTIPYLTPASESNYTVGITNAAGSTNVTWNVRLALPGMVEAWGSNTKGECNRPATLTNATAIAAGEYQSVAVTDSGTVVQWGNYYNGTNFYSVTNSSVATLPPTSSNLVAVSAGIDAVIGLTTSNTVVTWGITTSAANYVPTNPSLTTVTAIGGGWAFNVALLANSTVVAWGSDIFNQTNVPAGLTNVVAIAAGAQHTLALLSNGTVVAWGYNGSGQTNVPAGLSNVVAIAAGDANSMALTSQGNVVVWGSTSSGQTIVPAGVSNNVMAIAAGGAHSVALLNNGTVVAWGDNANGQATVPSILPTIVTNLGGGGSPSYTTNSAIVVKLIAAGGNHTMAAIFSPLIQYPIDVSKDLLLIYNATSTSLSSNVFAYYKANRPMVGNANSLGISIATNEIIQLSDYTNTFSPVIMQWLLTNATKRPQYVILFQDLPSRIHHGTTNASVQYDINSGIDNSFQITNYFPYWKPFVTSINMNGTNAAADCTNYIKKLISFASNYCPNQLIISASAGGYSNTNWYFDGGLTYQDFGYYAWQAVTNVNPTASVIGTSSNNITSAATNVAGYFTCGSDCTGDTNMFADGTVRFFGQSAWYVMTTIDSFDGQRNGGQACFLSWFTTNSFGGTNYSNTPVGALTTVDEPGQEGKPNPATFYGEWVAGKSFAISAWAANSIWPGYGLYGLNGFNGGPEFQAVGDPFVRR